MPDTVSLNFVSMLRPLNNVSNFFSCAEIKEVRKIVKRAVDAILLQGCSAEVTDKLRSHMIGLFLKPFTGQDMVKMFKFVTRKKIL